MFADDTMSFVRNMFLKCEKILLFAKHKIAEYYKRKCSRFLWRCSKSIHVISSLPNISFGKYSFHSFFFSAITSNFLYKLLGITLLML